MTQTCPHCSHTFSPVPVRRKPVSLEAVDTATMSEPSIRAYYKRTAPLADIEFFRSSQAAHGNLTLLARADQLRNTIAANSGQHTAETKRGYAELLSAWRTDRLNQDIAVWSAPDKLAERYGDAARTAMSNYRPSYRGSELASPDEAARYGRLAGRYARIVLDGIAA